jgi:monoamine oxidase
MTRKEFIKMCGILGISLPLASTLLSCKKEDDTENPLDSNGKVIIIGAGVGGLSAGYLLNQRGIDFEILEASAQHGGRIRINTDFADFPIPLGAEWIETDLDIFDKIVNDSSVNVNVQTFADAPDNKFLNGSWFNFFEQYITPSISNKITYNTIVQSIDYSGDKVIVNTQSGQRTADKVIISVPVQILRDGDITFSPNLPQSKINAINNVEMWEGFKAFFEFSTDFYGDGQEFTINPPSDGEKLYYDATFGQNSNKNILGLFVVGKPAQDYISRTGSDLKNFILAELDGIFSNQATPNYVNHIVQNWNNEPFIKSGYISDDADWQVVRELGKSVSNKVYFAGGAYTDGEDWVSVHAAALSAKSAVEEI